jgi:hypothetical protein
VIAPLRRLHGRLLAALSVLVPAGFLAGLAARTPEPRMAELPGSLAEGPAPPAAAADLWKRDDLFRLPIDAALSRAPDGGLAVTLEPRSDLRRPEVLVYWAPSGEGASNLPPDAILLGRLSGTARRTFRLPVAEEPGGGLFLYSLGHQSVLEAVRLDGAAP